MIIVFSQITLITKTDINYQAQSLKFQINKNISSKYLFLFFLKFSVQDLSIYSKIILKLNNKFQFTDLFCG